MSIKAENGIIKCVDGKMKNVNVSDSLKLEVEKNFNFAEASIGNILTISSGVVELDCVTAKHLVVKGNAVVYIHDTCVLGSITKDETARVENV